MNTVVKKPRTLTGSVVSNRMNKTIVVSIVRKVPHPKYGKYIKRYTRLFAHDPDNSAQIGDTAVIQANRPISKKKHWLLIEILKK
jgi:small subunit ribosomal protein S17